MADLEGTPLGDFADALKSKFMSMPSMKEGYQTFYDDFMGFFSAVAWKEERWLQALLAMELALFVAVVALRRRFYAQMILLFLVGAAVYASERINAWGAENYRSFATQNYFDSSGLFMGIVYAGPLLCIMMFQLINALIVCSNMLVKVKAAELKRAKGSRGERTKKGMKKKKTQ